MIRRLIFALLLVPSLLSAHEVDTSEGGVTIFRDSRHSDEGGHRGYGYTVENENDYPVWFTVELTEAENVHDGLVRGRIYLYPGQTVYLGTVMQRNPNEPYRLRYRWEVEPAPHEPTRTELRGQLEQRGGVSR